MGSASSVLFDKAGSAKAKAPNGDTVIPLADIAKHLQLYQNCGTGEVLILVDQDIHNLDLVPDPFDWYEVQLAPAQQKYFANLGDTKMVTLPAGVTGAAALVGGYHPSTSARYSADSKVSPLGSPREMPNADPYGSFRAVSQAKSRLSLSNSTLLSSLFSLLSPLSSLLSQGMTAFSHLSAPARALCPAPLTHHTTSLPLPLPFPLSLSLSLAPPPPPFFLW